MESRDSKRLNFPLIERKRCSFYIYDMNSKTYRVIQCSEKDSTMLDLVNIDNPKERYPAHPEDFVAGMRVYPYEFAIMEQPCYTKNGMRKIPIAVRLSQVPRREEAQRKQNTTKAIVNGMSITVCLCVLVMLVVGALQFINGWVILFAGAMLYYMFKNRHRHNWYIDRHDVDC